MRRRNVSNKHILILIAIIIIVILAIFSYTLKEDRQLNKFEALIKDSITSVEKIIGYPFKFVFEKFDEYKELKDIREKYQSLVGDVDRIKSLQVENIELRKQLTSMKEELDIDYTINGYSYLNATVINRNVAHWYNTITIDKGSFNGIEVGMAVVNSDGLIGKIISTTTFTSEVKLLTTSDTNNKISVSIVHGNNKMYGLIKNYNSNGNYLEVEGISNTENVGNGDYVYTSGLGGVFPSGILIGTIEGISTDEYDLAKILKVKPIADFDDINYVVVLKREDNKK